MGAELKAVLTLDNKDYQTNLQSAVKETHKYQKQVDATQKELDGLAHEGGIVQKVFQNYGKEIGLNNDQMLKYGKSVGAAIKTVGLIGGAIAVATAAFEGYKTVVSSCQDSLDDFQSKMEETKNIKDGFFIAINEGNVSGFLDNIGKIVTASKTAYKEMAKLRDLKLFMDPEIARIKSEQEYHAMKMDDQSLSKEERKYHAEEKEKGDKRVNEIISSYRDSSMASFLSSFRLEASKKGYDPNQWTDEEIISRTNYAEALTTEKNKKRTYETADYPVEVPGFWEGIWKLMGNYSFDSALDKLPDKVLQNPDYQFADVMSSVKTEDWEKMLGYMTAYYSAEEELRGREHTTLMEKQGLNNELYGNNDNNGNNAANKEIKFNVDTNILKLLNNIGEINSTAVIKLDQDKSLKELEADRRAIVKQLENAQSPEDYVKIKAKLDNKDKQIENFKAGRDVNLPDMNDQIHAFNEQFPVTNQMEEARKEAEETFRKINEGANTASENVGALGNVFGSLGNAIGGTAGEILGFFGMTSQAIADILPQIATIITAKQAEAIASGTAEASKLPFFTIFPAIASIIATIAGVFASLPSFAEGGIFDGKTSMGDYNIARVNSGEMILNNSQQGRLFRLLNEGGAIGNRGYNTEREWVIRGSDLVGVVKNYNKIQSKLGKNIMK